MYHEKLNRQYHQEYINKQPDFIILDNIQIACKPEIEKYGKMHITNNHEEIADYLTTYKDIKGVLRKAQESGGLIRHAVLLNAHPEVLRLFILTYIKQEDGVQSLSRALFYNPKRLKDSIHLAFEDEKKGMLRPESFDLLLEAYSECDQELFYSDVIFAMKEGGDSLLKQRYGGNWLMLCIQHPLNISSTILLSATCAENFFEFQHYFKAMSTLFLGLAQPQSVVETSGMMPDVSNAELMTPISSRDFFLRANNPWKKSMLLYKDRFGKYPTNDRKVSFQSIELAKTEASKSCCSVQ